MELPFSNKTSDETWWTVQAMLYPVWQCICKDAFTWVLSNTTWYRFLYVGQVFTHISELLWSDCNNTWQTPHVHVMTYSRLSVTEASVIALGVSKDNQLSGEYSSVLSSDACL